MGINRNQIEGRIKEAAGKIQEIAGRTVGSGTQQAKGMVNKVVGAAQAAYGDMKQNVEDDAKDTQRKRG